LINEEGVLKEEKNRKIEFKAQRRAIDLLKEEEMNNKKNEEL